VIRIERVPLPAGLRAFARRDHNGDLVVYVSTTLDAAGQRAAVMEAVRATRRAGWRGVVPLWLGLLALGWGWLSRGISALRAQPAALTAAVAGLAAAGVVAGIVVAAGPHQPGPALGAPPGGSSSSGVPHLSYGGPGGGHGGHGGQIEPVADLPGGTSTGSPEPGRTPPRPGRTSPAPGTSSTTGTPRPGSSTPAPTSPSPSASSPSPSSPPPGTTSPSPSPSPSCIAILGIRVCLGL
jgi:hypothetical protein